jgi:hypothetical protein
MGFVPMVFFGQWGLPFGVPKSRPLTVVVGTPIEAPKRKTATSSNSISSGSTISSSNGSSSYNSAEQRVSKRTTISSSSSLATPAPAPETADTLPLPASLSIPKGALYEPSDEEIESFLGAFIVALEKLYSEHCEQYGMGHVKLVIV